MPHNAAMSEHNTPEASPLGRASDYPQGYDPTLLFPIRRAAAREELGIAAALPFAGLDRWHAYELSWLDARGKPRVATASIEVPADSPNLIESKSLKLYLNSFNAERLADAQALRARIETDLSAAAGAPVRMAFGLPPMLEPDADLAVESLDALEVAIDDYGPPDAQLLQADGAEVASETLGTALFKSNCPVTGQPDWASLEIAYQGPRIDREGLLRYLVGFREHRGFHEQCVERVFVDVMARCAPRALSVLARYTRRGGLDINPWRATAGLAPPAWRRDPRQ